MKASLNRLFAFLLVLVMVFSLGATAFADELDDLQEAPVQAALVEQTVSEPPVSEIVTPIRIELPADSYQLNVGDGERIVAYVTGEGSGAKYNWYCSDRNVVAVTGSEKTATITGVAKGTAKVALTVTAADGRSEFAYVMVTVNAAETPVTVSGGTSVTVDEGTSKNLTASVSGGSGSYEYAWDADGSVYVANSMRNNAEIYAGRTGAGTVSLTVYDAENRTNNATTRWTFTVSDKQDVAPTVELSRGSIDIGAGGEATLMLSATGGSGTYDYYWSSDSPGTVSVTPNGATAALRAAATIIPGSNRAEITAVAVDKVSGLTSNTAKCVVVVSGGTATFNVTEAASAGAYTSLGSAATKISDAFKSSFGSGISATASVRFTNPSGAAGTMCLQDTSAVRSGTSYSFYAFQTMLFRAASAGTFSTTYMITDGSNTISGNISVTVTGGIAVTAATLSNTVFSLTTYSSQALSISVLPVNASYSVTWASSNTMLVGVTGSGNAVKLNTYGNTGTATVTATVVDATGRQTVCVCTVYVFAKSPTNPDINFSTSLTLTLGSDYYGSKLADSMVSKFKSAFNTYPVESDTIVFSTLGNSRFGTMYTKEGAAVVANRNYTFRDWIDMYFIPSAAGTYALNYTFRHGNNSMRGEIKINVQAANMTVLMNPTAIRMAPYSSQYVSLGITPATGNYRVTWASSDTKVATVSGSNATAVITSVASGTATITATVTDGRGSAVVKSCTVQVGTSGSTFNPSVATTLGIPYVGTGTSTAMRNQFSALYGTSLSDSAIIRFASTGNTDVAVMRLADGSMIRPNTSYTLAQYVAMYTQPVSEGTYSVPYTLTYAGKELNGTVSVMVNAASISSNFTLPSSAPISFADPIGASNGGTLFAESIRNTVGNNWAYVRFSAASNAAGTLYLDRNYTTIGSDVNVTPAMMTNLYFVPSAVNQTFSAPYTVYSANGAVVANGNLVLSRPGTISFADVPASAYYASAVNWAVSKNVTSGTSATTFSPAATVTRGQAVTFLWRAAGQPKALAANNPFKDVSANAYYYDAVLWAIQQGITNGTSWDTFSPDAQLNRDQLLTFLCRASGSYAGGDNWSQMAVNWATTRGLLTGVPGTFVAASACPRSDVVYYLWKNYSN